MNRSVLKGAAWALLFLATHIGASIFATHFFSPSKLSTIFWPASGIAIAGILLGGIRYLPLIIMASSLASLIDGRSWQLTLVYAFSNGLDAVLAWFLVLRVAKIDVALNTARDYLKLTLVAGVLVPIPGALISAGAIQWFSNSPLPLWHHTQTWWMGNSFGVILITPLALIWRTMPEGWTDRRRLTEAATGIVLTILSSAGIVFGGISFGAYSLPFVGYVSASWAAIRFGRRVTLIITAIIAAHSITALHISFATATRGSRPGDFLDTWLFLVTLSTVGMALATTFNERRANMQRMSELLEAYRREEAGRRESDAALKRSAVDFQRLVETAAEGIWTIDAAGKTTFMNARMAEMLGYTPDALLGKTMFELMPPESHSEGSERLARRKSGVAEEHEAVLIHKNGSLVRTFMSTNAIKDNSGAVVGALAMVTDISARTKAESALRENEDRYRKIVEVISDAVMVHQSGIILYGNPAAAKLLGFEKAESLIGLNGFSFMHPDDQAKIIARAQQLIQNPTGAYLPKIQQRIVRPDGTIVTIESVTTNVHFNGRPAMLVIAQEIKPS